MRPNPQGPSFRFAPQFSHKPLAILSAQRPKGTSRIAYCLIASLRSNRWSGVSLKTSGSSSDQRNAGVHIHHREELVVQLDTPGPARTPQGIGSR